jgi:hypothetical protein
MQPRRSLEHCQTLHARILARVAAGWISVAGWGHAPVRRLLQATFSEMNQAIANQVIAGRGPSRTVFNRYTFESTMYRSRVDIGLRRPYVIWSEIRVWVRMVGITRRFHHTQDTVMEADVHG